MLAGMDIPAFFILYVARYWAITEIMPRLA